MGISQNGWLSLPRDRAPGGTSGSLTELHIRHYNATTCRYSMTCCGWALVGVLGASPELRLGTPVDRELARAETGPHQRSRSKTTRSVIRSALR